MEQEGNCMRVAISGSSGLIGKALADDLCVQGYSIIRVSREGRRVSSDCVTVGVTPNDDVRRTLDGIDAFIHLAGETISSRWTKSKKAAIFDSRVEYTREVVALLSGLANPPKTLLTASAVGIYGDRNDESLSEDKVIDATPDADGVYRRSDFLVHVCREWEAAAGLAEKAGIRVVCLRFGAVLSKIGGALPLMAAPFKFGLGGVVGSGRQYLSWTSLDDAIGAARYALLEMNLCGPVNIVSPNPVTNDEFTKILGRVLRRPTLFHLPAFAARLVFGELADGLLLSSQRAVPKALLTSGYEFQHPYIEDVLRKAFAR
jgi:uncharacterized protein (TIGR01777 family)